MNRPLIIAAALAFLLHALLLFGFRWSSAATPLPTVETDVEVSLVAVEGAPQPPPAAAPEEPALPPPPVLAPPPVSETPPPPPVPAPEAAPSVPKPEVMPPKLLRTEPALPRRSEKHPEQSSSIRQLNGPSREEHDRAETSGGAGVVRGPTTAVRARNNPKPPYPDEARRLGQQGRVLLEVQVSADGRATHVNVKHSSGFPSLDRAAVEGVERWTFEPARTAGLPVPSRVDVPVSFSIAR